MRKSVTFLGGAALLLIGYVLGSTQFISPAALLAQAQAPSDTGVDVSDETKAKIKAASDALKAAMDALIDENRYSPAVKGINTFMVLSGGGNAMRDLESSTVVDPETYAALYCNLATDNVAAELGRDAQGRLTYKNKVVRMYPVSVLQRAYAIRSELTGEELLPPVVDETAPAKSKKKAAGGAATEGEQ